MGPRFSDTVCLVTGAGSGIGQATALAFAAEGAHVLVADINVDGGKDTVNRIEEMGQQGAFCRVDTSQPDEITKMMKDCVDKFGRVDIAVNAAGVQGVVSPFASYPDDVFLQIVNVNLIGVWHSMKAELNQMLKQGQGVIVNVASVAGLRGLPNGSAYTASKHGVVGLTKAVALENARKNIRINAVCPGYVETPFIMDGEINARNNPEMAKALTNVQPMRRLGQPKEIADAILWMASDQATFVTGTALSIDGGTTA